MQVQPPPPVSIPDEPTLEEVTAELQKYPVVRSSTDQICGKVNNY